MKCRRSFKSTSFYGNVISEVLLVGFPAALVILLGCSANIVLTHYMAPYGDLNVAAFGVVQKVGTITIQITIGMAQGIMPLIGYNYAAGNKSRTREINRDSFIMLVIYSVLCLVLIEMFPTYIISAFIPEENTVKVGAVFLKCWILCAPGMCFVNMFNSIFQAMGKWKQSMFLSVFRQALLLIPMLIILNRTFGLYGLIWSQPVSDTLSLLLGILLYTLCGSLVGTGLQRTHIADGTFPPAWAERYTLSHGTSPQCTSALPAPSHRSSKKSRPVWYTILLHESQTKELSQNNLPYSRLLA